MRPVATIQARHTTNLDFARVARPFLKAYLLGYLTSTSPKILQLLSRIAQRKVSFRDGLSELSRLLKQATAYNKFPTFCGVLVGGSSLLYILLRRILWTLFESTKYEARTLNKPAFRRTVRLFAALISASFSFVLLNSPSATLTGNDEPTLGQQRMLTTGQVSANILIAPEATSPEYSLAIPSSRITGKTLDLTLLAFTRALEVIVKIAWTRTEPHGRAAKRVSHIAVPSLFSASVALIMYAWFYTPQNLPRSYVHWISRAAELDHRLLLALRYARYGTWTYGKDTGMAGLLGSMCEEYNLPASFGDPAQTIPIPCEVVHMGAGRSCEKHAGSRFIHGFLFAAKMYTPIHLLILLRHYRRLRSAQSALPTLASSAISVARSSAFLGAFISVFYYGVCLSRTRLGPRLFSSTVVTPQMWDSGLCVLGGCLLCGWSIMCEQARRRTEILFFVMPRAAAVWFPRRYLRENQWKEHLVFCISTAVVLTAVQEQPNLVSGILGRLLHRILAKR